MRISRADLERIQGGGKVEPRKPRRKARTIQEQYVTSPPLCPPDCEEGRRLFRVFAESLRALRDHRDTHR